MDNKHAHSWQAQTRLSASVAGEKRQDQHHTARVCGELTGGGEASVPRHMFLKEKICQ